MQASVDPWAVVQTEAQHEHAVRLLLMRERLETYLPRAKIHSRITPLFPSYIFVRIFERRFWRIVWTPHVVRVLMSGDKPATLSDSVIRQIQRREKDGLVKLPTRQNQMRKGDQIRIISGTFEGQLALFDGMSSHERVFCLLNLLGGKVRTELPGKAIQPVAQRQESEY